MPQIEGTSAQALATLQKKIDADPEIQTLLKSNAAQIQLTHDKGGDARKFQNALRDQITEIAKRKGYLPTTDQVFINPNDGKLEGKGGWAGLNTATKIAIIAAAGGAGLGGAAALGAFGAGAAGGAGGAGGLVGSGEASILSGASAAGGIAPTIAGTAATGGGMAAGSGAAGAGGILGSLGKYAGIASKVAPILGSAAGARGEAQVTQERNQLQRDSLDLSAANSRAQNELAQKQYQGAAPGQRLSTGLRASMAANAQPVTAGTGPSMTLSSGTKINPIHFSGMDPHQLIGDKGRELSNSVLDQELQMQLSGNQDKFQPFGFDKAQPAPQTGITDSLLSGGATAAGLLGAAAATPQTSILGSILTKGKTPGKQLPVGYDPEDPYAIDPRGV